MLYMPIVLPKCPDNYSMVKDKCRCKKNKSIKTKKIKVIKVKSKTKKKQSFLEENKGKRLYFKPEFKTKIEKKWKEGKTTNWIKRYGPNKGKCKKGYMKNPSDKFCYTWSDNVLKNNMTYTNPKNKIKKIKFTIKKKTIKKPLKGSIFPTVDYSINDFTSLKKTKAKTTRKTKTKAITTRKTKTKAITTRKTKTKAKTKAIIPSISKLRSYSPTINKEITRMNISPHVDIFDPTNCQDKQLSINGKCYNWNSKKVETYLLDNLKSKKPIVAKDVLGPNQNQSNCWFNTFFMMFFISDKGRKFMKNFRRIMITGNVKIKNATKKIPAKLRYPFWLLNKYITASLVGKKDTTLFANRMDTNNIIKSIHDKLSTKNNKFYKVPGEAGNPIQMFINILQFLYNKILKNVDDWNKQGINYHYINCHYPQFLELNDPTSPQTNLIKDNKPKYIIIDMSDEGSNEYSYILGREAKVSDFIKKKKYKFGDLEYTLDSIGVRDVEKHHICALITINGEDYMFDGENHTPLYKKKWRHYLNKDKTFKITPEISERYNLTKGYQCLVYYRSK